MCSQLLFWRVWLFDYILIIYMFQALVIRISIRNRIKAERYRHPPSVLHSFVYKSGPMISLMNCRGLPRSKLNRPVGSDTGGEFLLHPVPDHWDFSRHPQGVIIQRIHRPSPVGSFSPPHQPHQGGWIYKIKMQAGYELESIIFGTFCLGADPVHNFEKRKIWGSILS